jgi:hypothetical protein
LAYRIIFEPSSYAQRITWRRDVATGSGALCSVVGENLQPALGIGRKAQREGAYHSLGAIRDPELA